MILQYVEAEEWKRCQETDFHFIIALKRKIWRVRVDKNVGSPMYWTVAATTSANGELKSSLVIQIL